MSTSAGRHPTDSERARGAAPVLRALLAAAAADDPAALGDLYREDVAWLDATGTALGREEAVRRHRAIAARADAWAEPQQHGAKAVLRWARRGADGAPEERGALVVEVRRDRVIFVASC
jgi:ketosteroid isomerase-like protein